MSDSAWGSSEPVFAPNGAPHSCVPCGSLVPESGRRTEGRLRCAACTSVSRRIGCRPSRSGAACSERTGASKPSPLPRRNSNCRYRFRNILTAALGEGFRTVRRPSRSPLPQAHRQRFIVTERCRQLVENRNRQFEFILLRYRVSNLESFSLVWQSVLHTCGPA
jgi:hypothetical protein